MVTCNGNPERRAAVESGIFSQGNLIQIAGVMDRSEADMIADCGVDLLGFPLRIAGGNEDITEGDAKDIIGRLRPQAQGVVITYLTDANAIAAMCRTIGTAIVQLHGDVAPDVLKQLKVASPGLCVIKSLVVRDGNLSGLLSLIDRSSSYVDAYITDTFDPATGACGATGLTHDWDVSRRIVGHSPKPVILAGGLNPDNVCGGILQARPAGVDAHTGVEGSDGRKDRALIERFVSEARRGFEMLEKGRPDKGGNQ